MAVGSLVDVSRRFLVASTGAVALFIVAGMVIGCGTIDCEETATCPIVGDDAVTANDSANTSADVASDRRPDGFADAVFSDHVPVDSFVDAAVDGVTGADAPAGSDAAVDGVTTADAPAGRDAAVDARSADVAGAGDAAADGSVADVGVDAADGGSIVAGLVAYYPFDETSGTTSVDASGNGHTATMLGATFSSGLLGNAATMNGTNQYVSLPTGIVSGLTSFSIATWVRLTTSPPYTFPFDFGTGTTAYMFLTPNSSAGTLRFGITTSGNANEQVVNAPALPTGNWQHVCITLTFGASNSTSVLYVNGGQVGQNAAMTLTPNSLGNTTQNWIGRSEFPADPYLNGQIDNFRIYSRALSALEVQQLFLNQL
jgi:Concanavalin A-like lectin/glucanases superfamily